MSSERTIVGEACERFFQIDELVALFLHQAPVSVLLNCQRVCSLWNNIIEDTQVLQQHLFLEPIAGEPEPDEGSEQSAELSAEQCTAYSVIIDDILATADLETISAKVIWIALQEHVREDLTTKKDAIKELIMERFDKVQRERGNTTTASGKTQPRTRRSMRANREPVLNPIMTEYFAPILASAKPDNKSWSSYEDLQALPWAATGTDMTPPARQAFARPEASWRNMLVSQPPIYRLDWWHEWVTADNAFYGWGHQNYFGQGPITLGMLWDLVESRLRRGCTAQVLYFPQGRSPNDDPTATEEERHRMGEEDQRAHGFTATLPRVKITTRQRWENLPRGHEEYDMQLNRWVEGDSEGRREYEEDGFNALRQDCNRDHHLERWSRSDDFRWPEINGESSSSAWENEGGEDRWATSS